MALNDYTLGGTILIRGAEKAKSALGGVYRMSRQLVGGLGSVARMTGSVLRAAFNRSALAVGALSAAVVGGIKVWADFEQQIAKIGTLLPDGRKAMGMYGDAIRRMSIDTGQSAEVVSEGLFQAISAGVDTSKAVEFMGIASKAAVAGFTEMNVAVDGLTNVVNAYGLSTKESMRISDAFFVANKVGKTTFEELAQSVGTWAPLSATLGAGYEEVLSGIASITLAGVSTAESAVGIRSAMVNILKPGADAVKLAKQLNLQLGPAAIRKAGGFIGFLEQLKTATKGNAGALSRLIPDVQGLNAVLRLTSETGLKSMVDTMGMMRTEAGVTEKKFEEVSSTFGFQLGQLKQIGIDAFRSLGRAAVEGLGLDLRSLVGTLKSGMPAFEAGARNFFGGLRAGLTSQWPAIRESWGRALGQMGDTGKALFEAMDVGFGRTSNSAGSWGTSIGVVLGKVTTDFGDLITKLGQLGAELKTWLTTFKAGFAAGNALLNMVGLGVKEMDPNAGKLGETSPTQAGGAAQKIVDINAIARGMLTARGMSRVHADRLSGKLASGTLTDFDLTAAGGGFYGEDRAEKLNALLPRLVAGQRSKTPAMPMRRDIQTTSLPMSGASLVRSATGLKDQAMGFLGGHAALGRTLGRMISDAVGERPWNLLFKLDQKTEVDNGDAGQDLGGGGSRAVDHSERGAGDAVVEFRMQQKYLVTEGRITSIPLEFITVRGAGSPVLVGGGG